MGRKSNSSSGDGSTTVATVMGLRMIQCGRQTVHVIQPDGQVRQFVVPVRVSDLIHLYPHHFVSHATAAPSTTAGRRCSSAIILPLDTHLDTGTIYALLPLPRLFPSAPPSSPHLCSCFLPSSSHDDSATGIAALKAELRRHWPSSKISPDDGGPSSSSSSLLPRRLWEPALEIISEDRVLILFLSSSSSSSSPSSSSSSPSSSSSS
ncbi:hypothetical protein CKAN_00144500 [Cinnamomum micranthum f. kanehirae]|uniref:Uncharacterized protein n=1 Tax=Cinnamomum micranthum f. kanehirae TaxID=337451 RepID=A0A3S3PUQ1_9MAGN|nr:hypothetical protein CKAN_00144500 [Cinnamomum micranthum f. kanehirae]